MYYWKISKNRYTFRNSIWVNLIGPSKSSLNMTLQCKNRSLSGRCLRYLFYFTNIRNSLMLPHKVLLQDCNRGCSKVKSKRHYLTISCTRIGHCMNEHNRSPIIKPWPNLIKDRSCWLWFVTMIIYLNTSKRENLPFYSLMNS